jgi:hypothetical protein
MTPDLHQMTDAELKQYISAHRNDEQAFHAALEVVLSRRDPSVPSQPYPLDLPDPLGTLTALFAEKLGSDKLRWVE